MNISDSGAADKPHDNEYEEIAIKSVEAHEGGGFTIQRADGWIFGVPAKYGITPKPGDVARFYGPGIGSEVRGLDINGQTAFYKSPAEAEAERLIWIAEYDRKQREEEARSRAEYEGRKAADPLAFDWDREGPSAEAAAALDRVTDEAEFPLTYSGQAWRCAYRYWQATARDPDILDGLDPYGDVPGVNVDGLGLSGFQESWARNAVRQMRGKMPKANSAVLTVGDFEQDPLPSRRSAAADMKAAIR